MSRLVVSVLAALAAVVATGCNNTSAPTAPTTPQVPTVTESFASTLTINGAVTHPFLVGTPGTVAATLLTVGTGTDTIVGIALGTWNTTTESCQIIIANDNAVQGRILVGTAQTSGAFCVRVYDVGKLTTATTYDVTVTHQ
jgi:hypothetical protein